LSKDIYSLDDVTNTQPRRGWENGQRGEHHSAGWRMALLKQGCVEILFWTPLLTTQQYHRAGRETALYLVNG